MKFISNILGRTGFFIVAAIFFIYSIVPFYWAINTSLKTEREAGSTPVTYYPNDPTLANYRTAIRNGEFLISIVNSTIVAASATLLSLGFGGLAAYALGRYRFHGRTFMRYAILTMNLFPTIAVLPSLFTIMSNLGLTGNITSLIITYPIFTLPTTTWTLVVFFQQLPPDIEQAAYVDGATTFELFWRILLPLSMPVLLTTGVIVFVGVWSEYLLALAFTSIEPNSRPVTVAIAFLRGTFNDGELMAASVILGIPLLLIIFWTQRRFVTNTTEGAVKG